MAPGLAARRALGAPADCVRRAFRQPAGRPVGIGFGGSNLPSLTFAFTGATPVVTRQLAGHDESWINPGAIIEHEGELHMFANVFSQWPGHVAFPHLVSSDGATWTKADSSPAFTSDDIPFVDSGADVSAGYVAADGTWVLVFETVELSDPWVLGRATAPGPDGPWTIDPEPILTPGPTGSWDAGGLQWPSVVQTDDGYLMYFTALDRRGGQGRSAWQPRPMADLDQARRPGARGRSSIGSAGRSTGRAWRSRREAWPWSTPAAASPTAGWPGPRTARLAARRRAAGHHPRVVPDQRQRLGRGARPSRRGAGLLPRDRIGQRRQREHGRLPGQPPLP